MGPPLATQVDVVELVRQGRRDAGDAVATAGDPAARIARARAPAGRRALVHSQAPVRAAYLDSSVVLRVVLGQPDNLATLLPELDPFTSVLTQVECRRALDRLRFAEPSLNEALVDKWAVLARVFRSLSVVSSGRAS